MSWTTPVTWTPGQLVTAAQLNTHLRDNEVELRAGGIAIASQAAGDVIYGASATQFGRLAIGAANTVLLSNGTAPTWSTNVPLLSVTNSYTTSFGLKGGDASTRAFFPLLSARTISGMTELGNIIFGTDNGTNVGSIDWLADSAGGARDSKLLIKVRDDGTERALTLDGSVANGHLTWPGTMTITGAVIFSNSLNIASDTVVSGFSKHTGGLSTDATNPGATNFRVAGTSALVGAVTISSAANFTGTLTVGDDISVTAGDIIFGATLSPVIIGSNPVIFHVTTQWAAGFKMTGAAAANTAPKFEFGDATPTAHDYGTASGPYLFLFHNNNASTPAAASLGLSNKNGTAAYIWSDNSQILRMHTALPTNANDAAGTVIGTQTSTLDTKELIGHDLTPSAALSVILRTPVKHFRYRGGSYSGSEFHGIVSDWSPEFAMDPDESHPTGRSFNPVNAHGYVVLAIQALAARISALGRR